MILKEVPVALSFRRRELGNKKAPAKDALFYKNASPQSSEHLESNKGPAAYKAATLPLSYVPLMRTCI